MAGGVRQFLGETHHRGHERGDAFGVERRDGGCVDQHPVATEHHGRIDTVALAHDGYQFANCGHGGSEEGRGEVYVRTE